MKSLITHLVSLLIWPMTCIAVQREVPFQVIDARSHQPIVESVVTLSIFACDISYEENHQELFISCAESDEHGIVRFDFCRVVDGQYVLHIPGYIFTRFSYSAESSQLRLTNSVAGNIRVVRLNPHGGILMLSKGTAGRILCVVREKLMTVRPTSIRRTTSFTRVTIGQRIKSPRT
jgi:hypothetical protein